jgi:hypothetical protein
MAPEKEKPTRKPRRSAPAAISVDQVAQAITEVDIEEEEALARMEQANFHLNTLVRKLKCQKKVLFWLLQTAIQGL